MMTELSYNPWANIVQQNDQPISFGHNAEKIISNTPWDFRWFVDYEGNFGFLLNFHSIKRKNLGQLLFNELTEITISHSKLSLLPRFTILIKLVNPENYHVFYHFCKSLVSGSRVITSEDKLIDNIVSQIHDWSSFFDKYRERKLSINAQKGLIGEILFLNELILLKGSQVALSSWKGPDNACKDFILDNNAYEIKCIEPSLSSTVKISSIDQLSVSPFDKLYLIVYQIIPASVDTASAFSLSSLISKTYNLIEADKPLLMERFSLLLSELGIHDHHIYDNSLWKSSLNSPYIFNVDSRFPSISAEQIPIEIASLSYAIIFSRISDLRIPSLVSEIIDG